MRSRGRSFALTRPPGGQAVHGRGFTLFKSRFNEQEAFFLGRPRALPRGDPYLARDSQSGRLIAKINAAPPRPPVPARGRLLKTN